MLAAVVGNMGRFAGLLEYKTGLSASIKRIPNTSTSRRLDGGLLVVVTPMFLSTDFPEIEFGRRNNCILRLGWQKNSIYLVVRF